MVEAAAARFPRARAAVRWVLAALYGAAGVFHLAAPAPFVSVTPAIVPVPDEVVFWTGIAEIAGALGLLQPWSRSLRRAAGWGLAAYALAVWPANFNHFAIDMARPEGSQDGGLGLAYHLPRLAAQPLVIWAALWAAQVIDWPFRPRPHHKTDAPRPGRGARRR